MTGENDSATIPENIPGVCRLCGCTDDDCRQCIEKTGEPCTWVTATLCSACLPANRQMLIDTLESRGYVRAPLEAEAARNETDHSALSTQHPELP